MMVMARTSGNILDSEDNGDILLLGNLTTNRFYCAVCIIIMWHHRSLSRIFVLTIIVEFEIKRTHVVGKKHAT